ncbi:MAG: hypothetical protein ACREIA_05935 [Opitutaceae bacterium]
MAKRRGCGCLGPGSILAVLAVLGLLAGGAVLLLQSRFMLEKIAGAETGAKTGLRVVDWNSVFKGQLHVALPDEVWSGEVASGFPMTEDIVGFVKLHLSNPRFVADEDPAWLRVELDVEAEVMNERRERFPGRAVLRTQLDLDRASGAVVLSKTELVELAFTGEAGRLVGALQSVLAEAFAEEVAGYAVFEIPEGEGWVQERAIALLSDVTVDDNKVVVVLGR